eukprot:m.85823 g.85823  ORF g.85823 m.85823 type:complete len:129 (-) comp50891_c0_seq20:328-714(-)
MLLSVILAGVCLLATPVAAFDAVLIAPLVIGCCFFIIVFGCCGWFKQQALLRTMQIQGRAGGMESTSFDNNNQDPFSSSWSASNFFGQATWGASDVGGASSAFESGTGELATSFSLPSSSGVTKLVDL